MPQISRKIASPRLYAILELVELRRRMLRFARSLPRGPERNNRRQIAASLRSLFINKTWLDAHTVEGSQYSKAPEWGLPLQEHCVVPIAAVLLPGDLWVIKIACAKTSICRGVSI
jgi:hypothetical protein